MHEWAHSLCHIHNETDLLSQSKAFQLHHWLLRSWNWIREMNFYFGFIFTHHSYKKRETKDDKLFTPLINSTHGSHIASKRKRWHHWDHWRALATPPTFTCVWQLPRRTAAARTHVVSTQITLLLWRWYRLSQPYSLYVDIQGGLDQGQLELVVDTLKSFYLSYKRRFQF